MVWVHEPSPWNYWIETKTALLSPKKYFIAMPRGGGYADSFLRSLVYNTAGEIGFDLCNWLQSHWRPDAMGFLFAAINSATLVLAGAGILGVLAFVSGGKTDAPTAMRVSANLQLLIPAYVLVRMTQLANIHWLSAVGLCAYAFYAAWLLHHALVHALGANAIVAKLASGSLAAWGFFSAWK